MVGADCSRRSKLFGLYLMLSDMMETLRMSRKQVIESIETASHRRPLYILTSPTHDNPIGLRDVIVSFDYIRICRFSSFNRRQNLTYAAALRYGSISP